MRIARVMEKRAAEEALREREGRYPPAYSLRTPTDLGPGDHLCCLYETEEEHRAVLTPFLCQGLERGEKVVYIVDACTTETVLGYLRDDGLDVEPYLASGQLSILTVDDAYMREGVFDPDGMIALLRAETERALAEGYPALRVTGEMTWALRGLPGSERLIEYEAKLNGFFPGSKCLAICQYDRRRFDPEVLLDVLCTHPFAVIGTEVYDNFYYTAPAEFLGGDRPAVELRRWVQNLAEGKRAQEEIRRRNEELLALNAITETVSQSLDLSQILNGSLDKVLEIMRVEAGGIYLADEATERVTLMTHRGVSEEFVCQVGVLDMEPKILERVAEQGRLRRLILVSEQILKDTTLLRKIPRAIAREKLRSYMQVLIHVKGSPVGLLVVASHESRKFTTEEEELLSTIGKQIGVAIQNARLHEETQGRSAYLETLLQINATLRSTLPLSQVLETIAQGSAETLGYVGSLITVPDATGERLVFGATWGGRFVDAAVRLTGFEVASFSLSVRAEENPIVRAYLTGELQLSSSAPERIVAGLEPSVSPRLARLIEHTMGAELAICLPLRVGEKAVGVLSVFSPREQLADEERAMLLGLADQAGLAIENARAYQRLEEQNLQTITALATAVEAKDPYTSGHSEKVTEYAMAIAQETGLSPEEIEHLRMAGVLHDIGKIAIPGSVLNKPARLTSAERIMIESHPVIAAEIVGKIEALAHLVPIIRHHHEWYDGNGYPDGLKGEEIPLLARILAVADGFDAMTSDRPYRPAMSEKEALRILQEGAGKQWDAKIVKVFCGILDRGEANDAR